MQNKVILVCIDGMRPDGIEACGHPFVEELKRRGSYTLNASTVMPSSTLPCHMSMFHSVKPERHGITTNFYTPQVRPINGLFEQAHFAGKTTAMFYGWEPLRDIARPGSLTTAEFLCARAADDTDRELTARAIHQIQTRQPDFIFLYLVETDEKGGHDNGWMSQAYLDYISTAVGCVQQVAEAAGDEYAIIVTADHGGHEHTHGTDAPEDTTIPMFFTAEPFEAEKVLDGVTILDLAPTIAKLLEVPCPREWEGHALF